MVLLYVGLTDWVGSYNLAQHGFVEESHCHRLILVVSQYRFMQNNFPTIKLLGSESKEVALTGQQKQIQSFGLVVSVVMEVRSSGEKKNKYIALRRKNKYN